MFETSGTLTTVELDSTLVWLVILPLLGALLAAAAAIRGKGERLAARLVIAIVGAVTGLAVFHAIRAAQTPLRRVVEQHVGSIVRLGQLDLGASLVREPTSAALTVLVSVLSLAAVLHVTFTAADPREKLGVAPRIAWTCVATSGVMLVVLADALPVVVMGLGIATLAAWSLGSSSRPRSLGAALAGDVGVVLAAWIMFWSLGGAFGASGYTPDPHPRFALVVLPGAAPAPGGPGKAVVSLTTYEGALVTSDDGAPLPGEPLRSPFSVAVEPGIRSFRIQAGAATSDMLVTHVTLASGRAYVLSPYGPTASARNLADQLAVTRPTATGPAAMRAVLGSRTLAFLPVAPVIVFLVIASALLRLVPLARSGRGGLVQAMEVVPAVVLAMRIAPLLEPAGPMATGLALLPAIAALALAGDAAGAKSRAEVPRTVAASLASIAVVAVLLGEPAAALVIVVAASLGVAASIVALDSETDVRWLGVASASLVGVLPGAGTSAGIAAALAGAFGVAAAGRVAGAAVAPILVVTTMLLSLAAFRVYGASIKGAPPLVSSPPSGPAPPAPAPLGALVVFLAAASLLGGAALGAGTSAFGGQVAPLARRLVVGSGGLDHGARIAAMAFALALSAAVVGLIAARLVARGPEPAWLSVLRAPASVAGRVGGLGARATTFLARSVKVMDVEVLDDVLDLVSGAIWWTARLVRIVGPAEATATGARVGASAQGQGARSARVGVDDPRTWAVVRIGLLLGMVALLGLVVLSSFFLG